MARISLKLFFRDKLILLFSVGNIFSVLGLFFYLFFSFQTFEANTVFLHYTVHLGVDLIGVKSQIYSLPLGGLLIAIGNLVLAYLLYLNQKNLARLLIFSSLIVQFFLWLAGIFLVFINI